MCIVRPDPVHFTAELMDVMIERMHLHLIQYNKKGGIDEDRVSDEKAKSCALTLCPSINLPI